MCNGRTRDDQQGGPSRFRLSLGLVGQDGLVAYDLIHAYFRTTKQVRQQFAPSAATGKEHRSCNARVQHGLSERCCGTARAYLPLFGCTDGAKDPAEYGGGG